MAAANQIILGKRCLVDRGSDPVPSCLEKRIECWVNGRGRPPPPPPLPVGGGAVGVVLSLSRSVDTVTLKKRRKAYCAKLVNVKK